MLFVSFIIIIYYSFIYEILMKSLSSKYTIVMSYCST